MKQYGVNKKGHIHTTASKSKIDVRYKQLIREVRFELKEKFGNKIHSLYLYGSVTTGKAKVKTSDIDFMLLFYRKPTAKMQDVVMDIESKLSRKYKLLVREVGISVTYASEVTKDKNGLGCFIKHLCILISGENYSKKFPPFKPTKIVARAFNGDINSAFTKYAAKINKANDKEEVKLLCSQISRKIIRTGFSLVMTREKSWTTDLPESYKAFVKYYPSKAEDMRIAVKWSKKPSESKQEILQYMQIFGKWLSGEVKRELL
jgi:predicted nucleotidyltransferase